MADNDILLPKCKFSIGSVSPSSHHFILGLVSTFKHDDVSMLKTFMCGHSHVMTFLHLKVYNGWCKFSVGSVFHITILLYPRIGFKIIYAWTFMCNLSALKVLRKSHQNRLTHLRVTVVNRLGHCSSHQLNEWHCAWHKSLTSYSIWYLYYYRPQTKFGAR